MMAEFPSVRMRRTRQNETLRNLVRETYLNVEQLIYPLFIAENIDNPREISSMPGIKQWPLAYVGQEAKRILNLGIPAVLLFGVPSEKDEVGSQAYYSQGIIQQAIGRIKAEAPDMLVVTDVCLCEYTNHGHCGVIYNGNVQNDESLKLLARMALSHVVAGADIVMVKPALAYLDVIQQVREHCNLPIAAYNVSGEYAMIKAAAQQGWIDERRIVMEVLTGIRRAGADIIITYFAPEVAQWLQEK